MAQLTYEKEITGLILIDPYNDFISEGGKIWDRIKGVAEGNQCVPHMMQVLEAARKSGIRVFYAMHRRYRSGDYETWKYVALTRRRSGVRVPARAPFVFRSLRHFRAPQGLILRTDFWVQELLLFLWISLSVPKVNFTFKGVGRRPSA